MEGDIISLWQEREIQQMAIDYWNQVRIQATIAAMQGMLANEVHSASVGKMARESGKYGSGVLASAAVEFADALIAELQKKVCDNA